MGRKLSAVYLGGRAPKCNTELHDVVFVAGDTAEATYDRPDWAFLPWRASVEPIFDKGTDSQRLRALAFEHVPLAFKRRNMFTLSVDLPVSLRAGRPTKLVEEKRQKNAERRRRFRKARLHELAMLGRLVRKQANLFKGVA